MWMLSPRRRRRSRPRAAAPAAARLAETALQAALSDSESMDPAARLKLETALWVLRRAVRSPATRG